MSKTKLTLSIDQQVLQFARHWTNERGTSISKELENLFRRKQEEVKKAALTVESMRGVAAVLSSQSDDEISQQWVEEQ